MALGRAVGWNDSPLPCVRFQIACVGGDGQLWQIGLQVGQKGRWNGMELRSGGGVRAVLMIVSLCWLEQFSYR